jgi:hypothetical protein
VARARVAGPIASWTLAALRTTRLSITTTSPGRACRVSICSTHALTMAPLIANPVTSGHRDAAAGEAAAGGGGLKLAVQRRTPTVRPAAVAMRYAPGGAGPADE